MKYSTCFHKEMQPLIVTNKKAFDIIMYNSMASLCGFICETFLTISKSFYFEAYLIHRTS